MKANILLSSSVIPRTRSTTFPSLFVIVIGIMILLAGSINRVRAMHSGKSQDEREDILNDFRDGIFDVLVATDVLARGVDIKGVFDSLLIAIYRSNWLSIMICLLRRITCQFLLIHIFIVLDVCSSLSCEMN